MTQAVDYFMDDVREAKRLADKVDATAWASHYVAPCLRGDERILDVGCGPGVLASAVASAYPGSQVTGIDLSADRITTIGSPRPSNVRLEVGDASSMRFPNSSFDLVYCRFLLEYLSKRQVAVAEMARVCRPGGRVLLQDIDGQLVWHFPEDAELQETLNKVLSGLAVSGFDPFVGRKLFSMARSAGLVDLRVSVESYHLYAGQIDDHNFRLWDTKLSIAMPAVNTILGSVEAARSLKERFLAFLKRDDTLTYSVLFTLLARKPEQGK